MRNKVQPPTEKVDDQGSCYEINSLRRGSGNGLVLRRTLTTLRGESRQKPRYIHWATVGKKRKISAKQGHRI